MRITILHKILCFLFAAITVSGCNKVEIILHGEITGMVIDAATSQPLQDAIIKLNPSNDSTKTGSDGRYVFKGLTPGNYGISASKLRYAEGTADAEVVSANTKNIDIALDAIPALNYSKNLLNFGYYLTSLSVSFSKTGRGSMAYMVTPSQNWIIVEPNTGNIDNETDNITITINRAELAQPVYNEWIVIRSTYQQYDFRDTIDVFVGVHKIIFNPKLTYGTVADIEGNVYKTIEIGTQVWMAENLRVTKFKDNTPIPEVTDKTAWRNLKTPGYCWYNNDSTVYRADHGAMYNGYTVTAGKLCPTGWHVPSYDEWNTLVTFIGGGIGGGKKLKETGTTHWSLNTEAVNEYGFTALPGGWRNKTGLFASMGNNATWWASTQTVADKLWNFGVLSDAGINDISPWNDDEFDGYSIRCVKDSP